jgi:mannose-1-phosphate guanylyltransferase
MFQETVDRIEPLIPLSRIYVVVSEAYVSIVQAQVPGLPEENILIEPGPRGTAPCIGLAAVALQQRDPGAIMAVFPADHRVADAAGFRQAIAAAARVAQDEYLVTLGIAPDQPHTGYGYIQRAGSLGTAEGMAVFEVQRFTEKPDPETARRFVESGDYYWNGGIFIWQADTILARMEALMPGLWLELAGIAAAWDSDQRAARLAAAWECVPRTTIDYGIMEKASRVAVVPLDVGWDDVGNWANLSNLLEEGEDGNVIRGSGQVLALETTDSYLYCPAGRTVAAIGLEGFVVVETEDALLICPKERAQDVRDIVQQLKEEGAQDLL